MKLKFKTHKDVICYHCGRFIGEDGPEPYDRGPLDEGKAFRYSIQCWSCDGAMFYNLEEEK